MVGRLKKSLDVPSRRKAHPDILHTEYEWINDLSHKSHKLIWFKCRERAGDCQKQEGNRQFCSLTNIDVTEENILE